MHAAEATSTHALRQASGLVDIASPASMPWLYGCLPPAQAPLIITGTRDLFNVTSRPDGRYLIQHCPSRREMTPRQLSQQLSPPCSSQLLPRHAESPPLSCRYQVHPTPPPPARPPGMLCTMVPCSAVHPVPSTRYHALPLTTAGLHCRRTVAP